MIFFRCLWARVRRARPCGWGVFGARAARWGSAPRTPRVSLLCVCLCVLLAGCRSHRVAVDSQMMTSRLSLASFDSLTIYAPASLPLPPPRVPDVPVFYSQGEASGAPAFPSLVPVAAVAMRHVASLDDSTFVSHASSRARGPGVVAHQRQRERFYIIICLTLAVILVLVAWRLRSRD